MFVLLHQSQRSCWLYIFWSLTYNHKHNKNDTWSKWISTLPRPRQQIGNIPFVTWSIIASKNKTRHLPCTEAGNTSASQETLSLSSLPDFYYVCKSNLYTVIIDTHYNLLFKFEMPYCICLLKHYFKKKWIHITICNVHTKIWQIKILLQY